MVQIVRFLKAFVGVAPLAAALTPTRAHAIVDRLIDKEAAIEVAYQQLKEDIATARAQRLNEIDLLQQELRAFATAVDRVY